ncbi:MAG: ATP-binding protein, partial [Acidobacteriota bacterium]|nr:ATP-binding protein [Acidobacteriota bacterium]
MRPLRIARSGIALLCYLAAALLTALFWQPVFQHAPLALFFAAVAVAAWSGGFWTGCGVSVASSLTVGYLLLRTGAPLGAVVPVFLAVSALLSFVAEKQRHSERALGETSALLDTLFEQAPVGIGLFDRKFRFVRLNRALTEINGLPREAHLGRTVRELLPKLDETLSDTFHRVLETGQPISQEVSGETPAWPGEQRFWWVSLFPVRVGGEIAGLGAVCEEITEKKRAGAELQKAKEEAESANQSKDRFLATLSHELRTPLTPVLAIASVLEEEPRLPSYARDHLAMIRRNVELEARLIDDLLDLTRIERGNLEVSRMPTDLRRLIEDAIETCCTTEVQKGRIELTVDLAAESHRVDGDPPRLSQVLWNLLSNAVKFTRQGGRVSVRSRVLGDRLVIEVADDGIGIEPAALPKIFDAFEQADPSIRSRFGGLGLGLAISKTIVEAHGGTLVATSPGRGQGATFTLTLPSYPEPEGGEVDAVRTGGQGAAAQTKPGEGRHILLVEDHADTAQAMADLLGGLGYQVTVAGSVADALAMGVAHSSGGARSDFDLVVSDLGLPDGSGLTVMRVLSSRYG